MLAGIRKRLARKALDIKEEDDDKDDIQSFAPPANFIQITQGRVQFAQSRSLDNDVSEAQNRKDREVLENRIVELEEALQRLQERVNNSHCVSPTFEKELREQMDILSRVIKSKEGKQKQTCPGHKTLQTRFAHQESLLRAMQQENYALKRSIRHYERCLDDVMRKVVDAIVAEDILREEVAKLKNRVRDLEAQNAALSASPAKGRDEGYCTMSSGQPQPSNGHLEDLPEEPEQWLLPAEPCSTEMEDWSMSQEELPMGMLDDEHSPQRYSQHRKRNGEHDWIWNSNDFLTSTTAETDSESEAVSQLLQQKIIYSEDEDMARTEFTNEFYKLVDICSASARSRFSYIEGETDDEDDDDDDELNLTGRNARQRYRNSKSCRLKAPSPTPSEAGRAQVTSCSSSDSDELSHCATRQPPWQNPIDGILEEYADDMEMQTYDQHSDIDIGDIVNPTPQSADQQLTESERIEVIIRKELHRPSVAQAPMVKSKSVVNGVLRNAAQKVVRNESVDGDIVASPCEAPVNEVKTPDRLLQRPANSWRKSVGWKRVASPTKAGAAEIAPKQEAKDETARSCTSTTKILPTRIPTCNGGTHSNTQLPNGNKQHQSLAAQQHEQPPEQHQQLPPQQHQQLPPQQQQQLPQATRKSKIPPPVPVRRSYAC